MVKMLHAASVIVKLVIPHSLIISDERCRILNCFTKNTYERFVEVVHPVTMRLTLQSRRYCYGCHTGKGFHKAVESLGKVS